MACRAGAACGAVGKQANSSQVETTMELHNALSRTAIRDTLRKSFEVIWDQVELTSWETAATTRGAMSHKVGIWIDHRKAIMVFASSGHVTAKTVESDIGPHVRYSDRASYPTPDSAKAGRGEKKYAERNRQYLDRYYDEVISQMGQPEALLIFGPGEAKLQLKERLSHSKALSELVVEIESTDKLTDHEIVARVTQHYGIDR